MDDDEIIERGGTQEDISQIAHDNGACGAVLGGTCDFCGKTDPTSQPKPVNEEVIDIHQRIIDDVVNAVAENLNIPEDELYEKIGHSIGGLAKNTASFILALIAKRDRLARVDERKQCVSVFEQKMSDMGVKWGRIHKSDCECGENGCLAQLSQSKGDSTK